MSSLVRDHARSATIDSQATAAGRRWWSLRDGANGSEAGA
jgi:hypothetical protein